MNSLSNTKKLRMVYLFVNMMFMLGFISPYFIDHGLSSTTIMFSNLSISGFMSRQRRNENGWSQTG